MIQSNTKPRSPRRRARTLAWALVSIIGSPLTVDAQEPIVTQEFTGPPHYRLICHQAGLVIEDQGRLDHLLLYADTAGILHRVDYARGSEAWHTISIAAGTTCQVDPQE